MSDYRVHTPANPEFNGLVREYEKDVNLNFDIRSSGDPESDLLQQLDEQLATIFADASPRDWVRVSFIAGTMTSPASTSFDHFENMQLSDVIHSIVLMDQSEKLDMATDTITVSVQFIHAPAGNGLSDVCRSEAEVTDYLSRIRSLVNMNTKQDCFAKAVAFSVYDQEYGKDDIAKAALYSFRMHSRPQPRLLVDEKRKAAHDTLQRIYNTFRSKSGLADGEPVTHADYERCAQVLADPDGDRKLSYRLRIVLPNRRQVFASRTRTKNEVVLCYVPEQQHYLVVKNVRGFLKQAVRARDRDPDFCFSCNQNVDRKSHVCPNTCRYCKSLDTICVANEHMYICSDCKSDFPSETCLLAHKTNRVCLKRKICSDCETVYTKNHQCGFYKCFTCRKVHADNDHECYIQPLDLAKLQKQDQKPTVFVFYDTETAQYPRGDGLMHEAVMAAAWTICNKCYRGKEAEIDGPDIGCHVCGRHKVIFENKETTCIEQLVTFVRDGLTKQHIDRRSAPHRVYLIAHNAKRFDSILLFDAMVRMGIGPKNVISNGHSIMTAEIGENIKLIDSINFLHEPLANLSKTYELPIRKTYFPHRITAAVSRGEWIDHWPELEDYYYDRMLPGEKKKLREWFEAQDKSEPFDFWAKMREYINYDVQVLMLALMEFRKSSMQISGVCPFTRNFTLAGCVSEALRVTQADVDEIPITPYHSYAANGKVSVKSRIWLLWMKKNGYPNMEFERRDPASGLRFDGYDPDTKTIFSFNGCLWHVCDTCFPNGSKTEAMTANTPLNFNELRLQHEKLMKRMPGIIARYEATHLVLWEHQFDDMLKSDDDFRAFHDEVKHGVRTAITAKDYNLRDALFGGRVEALQLLKKAGTGRIMYKDFVSLYPTVMLQEPFPNCHPEFIFHDISEDLSVYFGLIHCTILPPEQLRHAVLPHRVDGLLCFPLCAKCADDHCERSCTHTPKERSLTGLWTSMEVNKAIEKGYKVQKVHCVMHHNRRSKRGRNAIANFLKLLVKNKIKYSGRGHMTDDELVKLLTELCDEYGIQLTVEEIVDNSGARKVVKLELNCIWGRLGIRTDRPNTTLVLTFADLLNIMQDQTLEIKDVLIVGDAIKVTHESKQAFIRTPAYSSLMTAIFTTAYARLRLFEAMDKLGDSLLYVDTDSCIYHLRENEEDPIETGSNFGCMSDEIASYGRDAKILEFVSGGAKVYGLKIQLPDGSIIHTLKHKGIRPNSDTYAKLSFESMKAAIRLKCFNVDQRNQLCDMKSVVSARLQHRPDPEDQELLAEIDRTLSQIDVTISVLQYQIRPNKFFELQSIIMRKDWRCTYDKRRLLHGGNSVPRGYVDHPQEVPQYDLDEDLISFVMREKVDKSCFPYEELGGRMSEKTIEFLCGCIIKRNSQYGLASTVFSTLNDIRNSKIMRHHFIIVPWSRSTNHCIFLVDNITRTVTFYDPCRLSSSHEPWRVFRKGFCNSEGDHLSAAFKYKFKEFSESDSETPVITVKGDSGIACVLFADAYTASKDVRKIDQNFVNLYKRHMREQDMSCGRITLWPLEIPYDIQI